MVLGTKRSTILALFLAYTAIVALVGFLLGIAMGTTGAQAVSTAFRWVRLGIDMAPFMKAEQALHTPLGPRLFNCGLRVSCPKSRASGTSYGLSQHSTTGARFRELRAT